MANKQKDVIGITDANPRDGAEDIAAGTTSERHAGLLNDYKSGESLIYEWARSRLGEVRLTDWSWGRAVFEWTLDDKYLFGDGFMFGGHIASVGDHVAAVVAMTVLSDSDDRFRTSRLETQFFRPVMKPSVRIEARVVNISRSLVNVEADYLNTEGKLAVRISAAQVRRRGGKSV